MDDPQKPFSESGSSPALVVTITRFELTPGCVAGTGYGLDPEGREVAFPGDWRTAMAILEAMKSGWRVEIFLRPHDVLAWRTAR